MTATSTELVKTSDLNLPVLATGAEQALMALQANLGGEKLTAGDLDRVKVPSGDGPNKWLVPDGLGDVDLKQTIAGVIVFQRLVRAYWSNPTPSEGTPPDCSSPDSILGYGMPGDALRAEGKGCEECPMSVFGSAHARPGEDAGRGQACKQSRELYLLTPESDPLPMLLNVPPTSLAPVRSFLVALAKKGQPYYAHLVELTLVEATNVGGQKYAKVKIASKGRLDDDALKGVEDYSRATEGLFARRAPAAVMDGTAQPAADAPPQTAEQAADNDREF